MKNLIIILLLIWTVWYQVPESDTFGSTQITTYKVWGNSIRIAEKYVEIYNVDFEGQRTGAKIYIPWHRIIKIKESDKK